MKYISKRLFMITLLEKKFIPDRDNIHSPKVRQKYGILCGGAGIFFNLLLFAFKFLAGLLSNSIAITADAFNNLSDAGSSIITLIGFKMAGQKPDSDHPFGHGRIEYISGFLVSIFILFMGFELVKTSVNKIFDPQPLDFSASVLIILILSILIKGYMAYYNRRIGKKLESVAMQATATDSLSDMVSTSLVLITTLISHYTPYSIDSYCGILVGLLILYAVYNAAKDTINPLMGTAPDKDFVQLVEDIVMSYDQVIGIHDIMVHNYGPGRLIISLHAEVSADGDLLALHDTIDLIEHRLHNELNCSAVIHMDPVCIHDEMTQKLKQLITDILAEIDPVLTMHDFRIVSGPTHTNLIFDVVTPFRYRYSDKVLIKLISEKVQAYDSTYFTVIDIDKNYT